MDERPESTLPDDSIFSFLLGKQIEKVKDEIRELENFFDLEITEPDISKTNYLPTYKHEFGELYPTIKLNPLMDFSRHEARHHVHQSVANSVLFSRKEEFQNFFENEIPEDWREGILDNSDLTYYNSGYYMIEINYISDVQVENFANEPNGRIKQMITEDSQKK